MKYLVCNIHYQSGWRLYCIMHGIATGFVVTITSLHLSSLVVIDHKSLATVHYLLAT